MEFIHHLARPDANSFEALLRRDGLPSRMLVFAAEADAGSLPELVSLAAERGIRLHGAVFPELIIEGQFHRHGMLLLGLDDVEARSVRNVAHRSPQLVADELASWVRDRMPGQAIGQDSHTLMLFFDAQLPHIASMLDELYLQLGDAVNYAGVNAGSETFQPIDCLLDDGQMLQQAVLALLVPDHPGAVLGHGYRAPAEMVLATSGEGNRIETIDWQPAFDVYRQRVRQHYGVEITAENFYQCGVHFPFGILRGQGEALVRIPVGLEPDGSLLCVGEVPPHAMLALLDAPQAGSGATVDQLVGQLPETNPRTMLAFYCAGRRMHFGEEGAQAELGRLADGVAAPLMGALSLGEIGPLGQGGYPLFHNGTLVVAPWR